MAGALTPDNASRGMRIFVAVFPPPAAQAFAHAAIEALRRPNDRVSWVKSENLHFTLRFVGEIGADGVQRVREAALEAAAGHAAFDVALGGLGAFPDATRARVIWIGLESGAEALVTVARDLERALARRGFERERHRFSPHLTLGRVREPDRDWTRALADAHPAHDPAARFRVQVIQVVRSTLSPRGSTYDLLEDARLGGA